MGRRLFYEINTFFIARFAVKLLLSTFVDVNDNLNRINMKRLLLLFATIFVSTALFACTPKNPIEKLTKLADKVEKNHKSYTDEDWKEIAQEYAILKAEFEEKERSKEELKEFARQKGRIKGYMTKKTLNKLGKKVEDLANELEGGIEGFFEAIETIVEE